MTTSPSSAETALVSAVSSFLDLWAHVERLEALHGPYHPPIGYEVQDVADPVYHPAEYVLGDMEYHELEIDRLTEILEAE